MLMMARMAALLDVSSRETGVTAWMPVGTAGSAALTSSSVTWANTGNILLADGSYANTGSIGTLNQFSNYIVATNFAISIPTGSLPVGIEVRYLCADDAGAQDHSIRLFTGGAVAGSNLAQAVNWDTGAGTYQTRGGASELWGLSLSEADVENSGFGFAVAGKRTGGSATALYMDHMQMRVYYG